MSVQNLHQLFGLDGTRFVTCYDPQNRRTTDFADAFLTMPVGSDIRRMPLPTHNQEAKRFGLYGKLDLPALRQEIDGPYREVHDELAAIPLYGYNDSRFARHHQMWTEHLGRAMWDSTWQHHYAAALLIHFYRRITPQEYQSAAHMRLVYTVATVADWLTTFPLITDDRMDGTLVRNGHPAWHLRHPRSFTNDSLILVSQSLNVISAVVPDHHPFKREMHERAARQIAHNAHYFAYHAALDLRRTQATEGQVGSPVPVDDITLDSYQSAVFNRATDWIYFVVSMSRMLACYGSGIPDGGALMDYIAGTTTAVCVVDDIVDDPTDEDIRGGEPTIQLCLAVHKAKGLLGPIPTEDAADILRTLRDHIGVDTGPDATTVRRMYVRHRIPELALDYLEAVLNRLPQLRRAALEECGAPGDLPAFMLHWLAIDQSGGTERAQESGDLLKQKRFHEPLTRISRPDEDHTP